MPEQILIKNGSVILKDRTIYGAAVLIKGRTISAVGPAAGRRAKKALIINASGCYGSPGFIDTHIHGDPSEIIHNEIKHGVTSVIVAESCAPLGEIHLPEAVRFAALNPATLLGFQAEKGRSQRVKTPIL